MNICPEHHMTEPTPPFTISAEAEAFYRTFPEDIYPAELIEFYPRIANELFERKHNRASFEAYIQGLEFDSRGKRAGFAPEIVFSLQKVRDQVLGPDPMWGPFWA